MQNLGNMMACCIMVKYGSHRVDIISRFLYFGHLSGTNFMKLFDIFYKYLFDYEY